MQSKPAYPVATFVPLIERARPLFAKPPRAGATWSSFYFNRSISAVFARHTLAEIALSSLDGLDGKGDIVAVAARYMTTPPVAQVVVDAYVSGFLFGAWATIEASTFAANALGVFLDSDFRDLEDEGELIRVSPTDVLGAPAKGKKGAKNPKPAYAAILPNFSDAMLRHRDTLWALKDQHNGSKHRASTTSGAALDMRGIPPELHQLMFQRMTWTNITMPADPQRPIADHTPHDPIVLLDDIERDWRRALNDVGAGLDADITAALP